MIIFKLVWQKYETNSAAFLLNCNDQCKQMNIPSTLSQNPGKVYAQFPIVVE